MGVIDADLLTTEIIKISGVVPNFNEDVAICSVDSMPTVRAVSLAEFTCVQKQLISRNAQLLDAKEKMKSMVPVVRCRDCASFELKGKYPAGMPEYPEGMPYGYCYHWEYEQGMSPNEVDGNDFCSYGRIREDENGRT